MTGSFYGDDVVFIWGGMLLDVISYFEGCRLHSLGFRVDIAAGQVIIGFVICQRL